LRVWPILASAWHVVVRRAVADRLMLVAASITVFIATVLVASGPIYVDAVTLSGARRAITDAAVEESNLAISVRLTAASFAASDELVVHEVGRALETVGFVGQRYATSDSLALAFEPDAGVSAITVFRLFEGLEEHATLVGGSWPVPGITPSQAALSSAAAGRLHLMVGDRLTVTRLRDDLAVEIEISGVYEPDDHDDPFWYGDPLDLSGFAEGVLSSTYGPLSVAFETFFELTEPLGARFQWRFFPEHTDLEIGEIGSLRGSLAALDERLNREREPNNQFIVGTGLVEILQRTERSLVVTRSTMLVMTIQFSFLAGYALLLTAGLIADRRREEVALLWSRGADSRQVVAMAAMEGVLLVLPAVVLAPLIASWLLRSFNWVGPLANIDLTITPAPNLESFLLASLVGLGCIAALALPALRSARSFGADALGRVREGTSGILQRARIDVALVALAILGIWQLRRYGGTISESLGGRLGVDPLLVMAPAIGLFAGGIVALRLLPLLSQIGEQIMVRSKGLVSALGAWQVARRPQRYGRIVLFLTLSIGIGFFALAYADSWALSQHDRAAFAAGADVRDDGSRRFGASPPHQVLEQAYGETPGVEIAMPVGRATGRIARSQTPVRFVLLDASEASDVVPIRSDLVTAPFVELMDRLEAGRRLRPGYTLDGSPARLAVNVELFVQALAYDLEIPASVDDQRFAAVFELRVVLADATGGLFRIDLGSVDDSPGPHQMVAALSHVTADGVRLDPSYPLSVVAIEVRSVIPQAVLREAQLTMLGIETSDAFSGDEWRSQPIGFDRADWDLVVSRPRNVIELPTATLGSGRPSGLVIELKTGSTSSPVPLPSFFGLEAPGWSAGAVPVLVAEDLLEEVGLVVGDTLPIEVAGVEMAADIVGSIREFPTVEPRQGDPIVLDYQTFSAIRYELGSAIAGPTEFWLRVDPAAGDETVSALRQEPLRRSNLVVRTDAEVTLKSDPLALGTIGSLLLGFVAAAVLAGVAFSVNAAVSARQRTGEFALLRSAGLSSRQLVSWLSLENGVLVGFSLVAGTALGWLLVWLVLPLTALTQSAVAAVPEVTIVFPWKAILAFDAAIVLVLAAATAVLSRVLKRAGLEAILRAGGE